MELYVNRLSEVLTTSVDAGKTVVLKGIPLRAILQIDKSVYIEGLPVVDSKISHQLIFNRSRSILKALLESDKGVLIWDEYALLLNKVSTDLLPDCVVVYDNLRALFPYEGDGQLTESDFVEEEDSQSSDLPHGYAEAHIIRDSVFVRFTSTPDEVPQIPLFNDRLALKEISNVSEDEHIIDIDQDAQAIDLFVNRILEGLDLVKTYVIRSRKDATPLSLEQLEQINALMRELGGRIAIALGVTKKRTFQISDKTHALLKQYWGKGANFRELAIYEDPDLNNDLIHVLQGDIVQTIINEWKKARRGDLYRDLFLTAPTGSGKSLLFQLPAFYLSDHNEVTIVVSPLISLMKDQVAAIQTDRKFRKISYLNSELSLLDRERIIDDCKNGDIDILYMSPELLLSYSIQYFIGARTLGLVVIDEAHLVTTWGRDFRVDYWFLGTHLRKIRKYYENAFPVVAVTATAVYGGSNDMVFECVDALYLSNPHLFIGSVKRQDISFYIRNGELPEGPGYRKKKVQQTLEFIKAAHRSKYKTLVYTPYSRQVRELFLALPSELKSKTSQYYGSLPKDRKNASFYNFFSGRSQVMIATKAFGMGIDIGDIQIVYHHAPSGHLADYIQEVGRIARDLRLEGVAMINFTAKDTHFAKTLHGISAIKLHQLQEVLKKLSKAQSHARSQNLLLSTDDFAHIFPRASSDELSQKVMTSLMMIEKDFLYKSRFNVIVARPKKLFVKVYGRITDSDISLLEAVHPGSVERIIPHATEHEGQSIIVLNLDVIWKQTHRDVNFAYLKSTFYDKSLFDDHDFAIRPQLKTELYLDGDVATTSLELKKRIDAITFAFTRLGGSFFSERDLQLVLSSRIGRKDVAHNIANYLLSIYISPAKGPSQLVSSDAFIQRRLFDSEYRYRIFGTKYQKEFAGLRKRFNTIFSATTVGGTSAVRYVSATGRRNLGLVRLGYLLEILKLGSFEVSGGNSPMVFVRVNDPKKVHRTAFSRDYYNNLLADVHRRHNISYQIFEHFFLRKFDDSSRWDFIEDYFLGSEIDELMNKHPGDPPGAEASEFNPFGEISIEPVETSEVNRTRNTEFVTRFVAESGKLYYKDNMLTLETNGKEHSYTIDQWLSRDPVALHTAIKTVRFRIDNHSYKVLISKLRADHLEYYNRSFGKDKVAIINIDGQKINMTVKQWIRSYPQQFYQWWIKNEDAVKVSTKEKIQLIARVFDSNPQLLTAEHKRIFKR